MTYRKIHSSNDGINEKILSTGVRRGLAEAMEVAQPAVDDSDLTISSHTHIFRICCPTTVADDYRCPRCSSPLLLVAFQPSHSVLSLPPPLCNAHTLLIMLQTTALRAAFAVLCKTGDTTQPIKTLHLNEHH